MNCTFSEPSSKEDLKKVNYNLKLYYLLYTDQSFYSQIITKQNCFQNNDEFLFHVMIYSILLIASEN